MKKFVFLLFFIILIVTLFPIRIHASGSNCEPVDNSGTCDNTRVLMSLCSTNLDLCCIEETYCPKNQTLGRIGGTGGGLGPFANIELTLTEAGNILENVLSAVIGLITVATSLWFMLQVFLGALSWVSAGGDAQKVEGARERITNAIIGLIIVVAAWSLVGIIGTLFGLKILSPASVLTTIDESINGSGTSP